MEQTVNNIPANFTDARKIFGMFEIRNMVETVIIALPLVAVFFFLLPFGLTVKIISSSVFIIPACGFALIGVQDSSLFTFLRVYIKWRRNKRVLSTEGAKTLE